VYCGCHSTNCCQCLMVRRAESAYLCLPESAQASVCRLSRTLSGVAQRHFFLFAH
jgi:hypothetical protein